MPLEMFDYTLYYIKYKILIFVLNKIQFHNIMKNKNQILFPKHQRVLDKVGENIKVARMRRKLTTTQVSERANISRNTLYLLEKGTPSVSLGALFNVLRVLGLQDDFLKLASDDEYGRKLQDLDLLNK